MASTPFYKALKENGLSTYVLPGAGEHLSASQQNDNFKVNLSKFVLLNFDLSKADFTTNFNTESFNVINDRGDLLVNSLRNYVANHETVIREARINTNTFFYDPNQLQTTSERIFWKWLRKIGLVQFEPAEPGEEYIDGAKYAVDDNAPDDYFKEYLWRERSTMKYSVTNIIDSGETQLAEDEITLLKIYEITINGSGTFKPGDTITVFSEGNFQIFDGTTQMNFIIESVDTTANETDKNNLIRILVDPSVPIFYNNFAVVSVQLVYERVVKYIGEITNISNVQSGNKSYTEITAHIPDQNGQTPDVLFKLVADKNYGPGNQYPIISSQDQPEIIGGELAESPIVINPENYPGDQYAYFDVDQKYLNSSGALDRKRGDYFGITETNRKKPRVAESPYVFPEFDGSNIDGITINFDTTDYVKMNIPGKVSNDFNQFNAQIFNNQAPKDFQFNTILWYYEVYDLTKPEGENVSINLYGISFINGEEDGNIATYKKFVTNGKQDGLSYQFNLNLNYNILNENVIETFDPNKIYSIYNFDLFNEVLRRVSITNDIFTQLASNVTSFQSELSNIKGLLYNQTDIRNINSRIDSLYQLLNLYKAIQIKDSDTIKATLDTTQSPPQILLESKDSRFGMVQELPVSTLYNTQNNTVINYKVSVPSGKDFLLSVKNDDNSDLTLDKPLNIVLDRDLDYRQTCVVKIYPQNAQYNKQLNISMLTKYAESDAKAGYALLNPINLPIDKNLNPNEVIDGITTRWKNIPSSFYPEKVIIKKVSDNYFLNLEVKSLQVNSFKVGDVLLLENFNLIFNNTSVDVSGQYTIVGDIQNNRLSFQIDLAGYVEFFRQVNVANSNVSNEYELDGSYFTQPASFRVNNGYTITITAKDRISTTLNERYLIEVEPLNITNIK